MDGGGGHSGEEKKLPHTDHVSLGLDTLFLYIFPTSFVSKLV